MSGEQPLPADAIAHAAKETGLSRATVRAVVRSLMAWEAEQREEFTSLVEESETVELQMGPDEASELEPGEIADPEAYAAALADGRVTELGADEPSDADEIEEDSGSDELVPDEPTPEPQPVPDGTGEEE